MRTRTWLGAFTMLGVVAFGLIVRAADDATLLRVFLTDGASLVSYGEPARIGDRVVFSMPTDSMPTPSLHLIDLPAARVDWDRTSRYAETARAVRYLQTQAETDYTVLASDISHALKEIAQTTDASRRLAIAEIARKRLGAWPESHYNYRAADVSQMLSLLDEAIADLRVASGVGRFDLSFSASVAPPPDAPLLPPPTIKEAIEQVLTAARVVDSAAERSRLLQTALVNLDRDAAALPAVWVVRTRSATRASLRIEQRIDRSYQDLTAWMLGVARWRAGRADIRGLERLPDRILQLDRGLGRLRPAAVQALLGAVEVELDSARRLRADRDRFAGRALVFRSYQLAIAAPLDRLTRLRPLLEAIKSSSISPELLIGLGGSITEAFEQASTVTPPDELAAAHATLVSALQLASTAARISVEAIGTGNTARGRDASSAAAGALMLGARATDDIQAQLRPPELR